MAPSTKRVETRLINRNNIEVALRAEKTNNTAVFERLLVNKITPQKVAYASAKRDGSMDKDQVWKEGNPRPWMNKEQSPFFKIDIGAEGDMRGLKNILQNDLKHSVSDHWVPATGDSARDYEQAQMLVDNIDKPYFRSQGFVCRVPSPELLDRATMKTSKVETAETPEVSHGQLTVSVLQHDHLVSVEHSSGHWSCVTVLGGEMIWIIWPDTPHNISTARQIYEDKIKNTGNPMLDLEAAADKLEHGIMWGQKPGDSLIVPPFHIITGLATKTTVLVEYSRMRFNDFLKSLEPSHIALSHSYYNSEALGAVMRFLHGNGLVDIITKILNNQYKANDAVDFIHNQNGKSMISTLVRKWDSVKDIIECFLSEENKKELQYAWTGFLTQIMGNFGHRCVICNYGVADQEEMEAHVLDEHYPGENIPATGFVNVGSHFGQNNPWDAGIITTAHDPTNLPTGGDFQANTAVATDMGLLTPHLPCEVVQPNQQIGNVGESIPEASQSAAPFGSGMFEFGTHLDDLQLEVTDTDQQGRAFGDTAEEAVGGGMASGQALEDTPEVSEAFFWDFSGEQAFQGTLSNELFNEINGNWMDRFHDEGAAEN